MVRHVSVGLGSVVLAAVVGLGCGTPAGGGGDAGVTDAGMRDAGMTDAGAGDAGVVDAGLGDAGVTDGGAGDAGVADGGASDGGTTGCPIGTSTAVVAPGTATTTTATIGFDGGTLNLDGATVTFPPGALEADTAITFTHEATGPATGYADTGRLWTLAPANLVLTRPVTVTLPYPGDVTAAAGYWSAPASGFERIGADAGGGQVTLRIVRAGSGFVAGARCHDTLTAYALVAQVEDGPAGRAATPTDLTGATVGVFVPNASGGLDAEPTTGDAHGLVRATGVPPSTLYYVAFPHQGGNAPASYPDVVASPGPTLDAAYLAQHRLHPTLGSGSTSLAVAATGLVPWQDGDQLVIYVPDLLGINGTELAGVPTAGDTSVSHTVGWSGLPLVDTTAGDAVFVAQLRGITRSDGTHVTAAVSVGAVSDLTMAEGQTTPLQVTMGPPASSAAGTLSATLDRDAFDSALRTGVPGSATASGTPNLWVDLAPILTPPPFGYAVLSSPVLDANVPDGTGSFAVGGLAYEDVFGGAYALLGHAAAGVNFQVAGSNGHRGNLIVDISSNGPPDALFGAPVAPSLGPVRSFQVNGVDGLDQVTGASTTPDLTWQPPSLGAPELYILSFYGGAVGTVLEAYTPATEFRVPPGILHAGSKAYLTIIAVQSPLQDPQAPYGMPSRDYQESMVSGWALTP